MANYVVAGATGRVGSVVARELLSRRASVRVIVRSDQAATAWTKRGASVAMGSLHDEAFLATLFRGAQAAFVLLPENVDPTNFHGARRRMADAIARADDVQKRAEEFAAGKPFPPNFRFVLDPNYVFTLSYDLRWDAPQETAYPSTFVIDRTGIVRYALVSKSHGGRSTAAEAMAELRKIRSAVD